MYSCRTSAGKGDTDVTVANSSVSVVIVTYFTGPSFWQCLDSCLNSDVGQIIIVNNGNRPEKLTKMRAKTKQDSRVNLLDGHGNVGFSRGCNLGASQASGEVLMFLNPDAVLHPEALGHLLAALEAQSSPCVVGGRLLNEDGTEQRGARRGKLTPWSALVAMSGLARLERFSPLFEDMHWERRPLPDGPQSVPAVSGACMMFHKADFIKIGRFDERYFLHVEDLDICRRTIRAGGKAIFVPAAEITHFGSTSRANIFVVNWTKATGLVRYFYRFSGSLLERMIAALLSPFIVSAIMIRTIALAFRR